LKAFASFLKDADKISLKDIEKSSLDILKSMDCTPTFHNYKGFPGAVCLSVNKDLVHGIPSDYILQNGDVVTLDLGATFEGAIADAAFTCIYGEPKDPKHMEMLTLCQSALNAGINAVAVGKRLGVIGSNIFKTARDKGFGIVDEYGGHGINYNQPHAPPFVSNKSRDNEGPIIQNWMNFAIEPMLIMGGSNKTKIAADGWTVFGNDIGCHFEHSICIDGEGILHIVTEHGMLY
jgi:methionyl aminopeptidase